MEMVGKDGGDGKGGWPEIGHKPLKWLLLWAKLLKLFSSFEQAMQVSRA